VTSYLLDTNVISETARQKPDPKVIEWIRQLPSLLLPAIAVYEIAAGVKRAPAGRRRRFLDEWFADLLGAECDILPLDRDAALASAEIELNARRQRRVVEHRDLLILGTAMARSLGVATRNVSHLRGLGVPIYDPFEDAHTL
jgi:predicted nucleic acid-binding protein